MEIPGAGERRSPAADIDSSQSPPLPPTSPLALGVTFRAAAPSLLQAIHSPRGATRTAYGEGGGPQILAGIKRARELQGLSEGVPLFLRLLLSHFHCSINFRAIGFPKLLGHWERRLFCLCSQYCRLTFMAQLSVECSFLCVVRKQLGDTYC